MLLLFLIFILFQATNFISSNKLHFKQQSLQCFDAVGWAAGRASGL